MTQQRNYPLEFYGRFVSQATKGEFASVLQAQMCPFTNARCSKTRKSDPEQTIGSCMLGYQGSPLVVCPHRFLQGRQIFRDCVSLLAPCAQYVVIPEVSMPGGSVDYYLVGLTEARVVDFAGIEIQALDTTGSGGIWQAREDLSHGELADTYSYGINWKVTAKTILVQLLHKTASFEALGKKLVLVIQNEFAEYLDREFQTTQLRPATQEDSVHFHIYCVAEFNNALQIVLHERRSTTLSGIERMLNVGRDTSILLDDVLSHIAAKLPGMPLGN
ncbi:MAG TPA: NotI family restriction endonuclease [Ktedonobacterales bacterium]|nr:NotI family restriction endonuclease [Ktedonobacterales bacterium]